MREKRKICVVTGSRAEYGLLYWTLKRLKQDDAIELQIIATGMHLSPEFGLTYKEIENDGFSISSKLEVLLSSDTPASITKSIGLTNIAFAQTFADLRPDVILVLGDRFEIFGAATAALVARIPIAHCHGGELTLGAIDDAFRHSITKMSHIHFAATPEYRRRIIQLGERPDSVHAVGALGIESIKNLKLIDQASLEEAIGFRLKKQNLLVTFHPVTQENETAEHQFGQLLSVLAGLTNTGLIFTMPNADTGGRIIKEMIRSFVDDRPNDSIAFDNLGQLRYLSVMKYVDGVIGNSSSGIIEAPSFKIGTINIGDRQSGRTRANSVIDCLPETHSIENAINKLFSPDFKNLLKKMENPYDLGNASEKICSILKSVELSNIQKKHFYDWSGENNI
ncbi:MAG: UDP-N-acetylglucosamine 2-epimerase [Chryseolinea sp.]